MNKIILKSISQGLLIPFAVILLFQLTNKQISLESPILPISFLLVVFKVFSDYLSHKDYETNKQIEQNRFKEFFIENLFKTKVNFEEGISKKIENKGLELSSKVDNIKIQFSEENVQLFSKFSNLTKELSNSQEEILKTVTSNYSILQEEQKKIFIELSEKNSENIKVNKEWEEKRETLLTKQNKDFLDLYEKFAKKNETSIKEQLNSIQENQSKLSEENKNDQIHFNQVREQLLTDFKQIFVEQHNLLNHQLTSFHTNHSEIINKFTNDYDTWKKDQSSLIEKMSGLISETLSSSHKWTIENNKFFKENLDVVNNIIQESFEQFSKANQEIQEKNIQAQKEISDNLIVTNNISLEKITDKISEELQMFKNTSEHYFKEEKEMLLLLNKILTSQPEKIQEVSLNIKQIIEKIPNQIDQILKPIRNDLDQEIKLYHELLTKQELNRSDNNKETKELWEKMISKIK